MATKNVKAKLTWDGAKKFTSEIKGAGKQIETSFEKGKAKVRQFEAAGKRASSKLKAGFSSLTAVLGPLGLGVGIGAAVFGMKKLITSTIEYRDTIGKLNKATGISVEFLSSIGFAAEQSGSSFAAVKTGLRGLVRQMSGVKDGLSTSILMFEKLNVKVLDNEGNLRTAESVFFDVAEAIKQYGNDTEAAAIAQELFGRSGIDLIPLLKAGKDGLKSYREESDKLNKTLSEDQVKAAAESADAINRLGTKLTALGQNIASDALPLVTDLANAIARINEDLGPETSAGKLFKLIFGSAAERKAREEEMAAALAFMKEAKDEIKNQPPEIPWVKAISEELPDAMPAMEKLLEIIKIEPNPAPPLPSVQDPIDELEELRQEYDSLVNETLIDVGAAMEANLIAKQEKAALIAQRVGQFWGEVGAQIGAAVAEGENFLKTLEGIAKQLAKRVFAGLIGAGIGFIFGGPAGAQAGFQAGSGFNISGFRAGGSPPLNETIIAGENGPELFQTNRPGRFLPAHESRQQLGRGDVILNQTINVTKLDNETLEFDVIPRMRRLLIERFGVSAI